MKKHYLLIILFTILSINKARAQSEFKFLLETDEVIIYVKDIKTINVEHFIWVKTEYKSKSYKNKKGKIIKKSKGSSMNQYCLNCGDETIKTIMINEYDSSGNVTYSSKDESEAEPVIPLTREKLTSNTLVNKIMYLKSKNN